MALPPLDYFLIPVPAHGLVTSLSTVLETLKQSGPLAPSHVIVTDDEHRPMGAMAVGRLWVGHQAWVEKPGADNAEPRLIDCQAWLEPVVDVAVSQLSKTSGLIELGTLAQTSPSPTLVVVDADGQYLGVLSPVRLLGWLLAGAEAKVAATPDGAGSQDASLALFRAEQQAWVMELSHALKTPITTLLGLSTLLIDRRVGSLSDRQFRYVSLMRQSIRKLTGLINLLLDWMRLESDQIYLTLERVSIQPWVNDLLPSFLSAQLEAKTAPWAEKFQVCLSSTQVWVMADPLRLRQSLHYILSYLVAHGAEPSGLVVEYWGPWLGFTLWSRNAISGALVLPESGSPNDAALSPESLPSDRALPQTLQGLGLNLARRLSQLHGGEVSGFNLPTWGSHITLLLPAPTTLTQVESTVLVLLASASEIVIEQVYGSLRSSSYRFVVAPCCQTLAAMQTRLKPLCTLIHWESLPDAPTSFADRQALVQRLNIAKAVILIARADRDSAPEGDGLLPATVTTLALETVAQGLALLLDQQCQPLSVSLPPDGLTMLLLRPMGSGDTPCALPPLVQTWLQRYRCRLLQADDLDQASLLSRVWQPQALILDRTGPVTQTDLQNLINYPDLAHLPLVTLSDTDLEPKALALGLRLVSCPKVLSQPPAQAGMSLIQAIAPGHPVPER